MSDIYQNPTGGMHNMQPPPPIPKANLACTTCRKQKRKCDKALPACTLCTRMQRRCDYSEPATPPSYEEFTTLQYKVMELEAKLNNQGPSNHSLPYSSSTPATSTFSDQQTPDSQGNSFVLPSTEFHWIGVKNRFPAIAFLDSQAFRMGGVKIPAPSIDVPSDVLRMLEDGRPLPDVVNQYFRTIHKWMPIVSLRKLDRWFANPSWEAGTDMALLFIAMKLIVTRPPEGVEIIQTPIYQSTKRFVSLLEAAGATSLAVLQANVLITWYEYGHAIYPAAYMSAGWCVRYGNLLGINGHEESPQLLSRPDSWVEQEERRRTWWGVLIVDRLVAVGGQGHILNSQEPGMTYLLPANDQAWDEGEMNRSGYKTVSNSIDDDASPFTRLCQASLMIGKVMSHHYGPSVPSETAEFSHASQLYIDMSLLANKLTQEATNTKDFLSLSSPLALTFTGLCALCDIYSCNHSRSSNRNTVISNEAIAMQVQAIDGIKTVSRSIVEFADKINESTSTSEGLERLSPMIMDALYSAASNYAWIFRESGDESSQMALDSLRKCLKRLGTQWRSAAEYLRILEAQEFTYTVGSARS